MAKRVIVTGASGGIGRAIALQCAADGHALLLIARREHLLEELARECLSAGAKQVSYEAFDIANVASAAPVYREVENLGDGELVLVNNAGFAAFGSFHEMSLGDGIAQIEVNLIGAMAACHSVIPMMLNGDGGKIFNIGSIATRFDFSGAVAYTTSKYGLMGLSRSINKEYREQGVTATHVVFGATDSDLWGDSTEPPRADMLTCDSAAAEVAALIGRDSASVIEEIVVTPPKGIV